MGVHNAGAPAAGLVTPVVVAWLAVAYGWRLAVGITAIITVPIVVLFFLHIRPTEPRRPNQPMRKQLEIRPLLGVVKRLPILFTGVLAIVADFT